MVDRVEMAALASEVLGRPVVAGEVPRQQWAAQLPEGPLRDGLARMMAHYDVYGFPGGNALVLRAILGREPRTLEQFPSRLGDLDQREAAVRSTAPASCSTIAVAPARIAGGVDASRRALARPQEPRTFLIRILRAPGSIDTASIPLTVRPSIVMS